MYRLSFMALAQFFLDNQAETFIRIDAQGNVYPCQNFNYTGSALGNIAGEALEDICSNDRIQIIRNKVEEFRSMYSKCSSCALLSYCNRGCPGVEYCDEFKHEISNECLLRKEFFKRLLIESEAVKYVRTQ